MHNNKLIFSIYCLVRLESMEYNIREKQSENKQNRTENEVFKDGAA